jgi:hypothetical protein
LRALPTIAEALRGRPMRLGAGLEVLTQGSQPRRALLQQYGDGRGKVLVGSHSFWEGIDMPGDALQCVLIDKLPFPPPNDPLVEARVKQLEAPGRNAFDEVLRGRGRGALKQGAGRLIRTETDRGLLVVCDPRLRQMGYGRRLMAALPPMGCWPTRPGAGLAGPAGLDARGRRRWPTRSATRLGLALRQAPVRKGLFGKFCAARAAPSRRGTAAACRSCAPSDGSASSAAGDCWNSSPPAGRGWPPPGRRRGCSSSGPRAPRRRASVLTM